MAEASERGPVPAHLARRLARLRRIAPRIADLEDRARRRIPDFCFGFLQSGSGDERGRPRNAAAFAGIEVVPRYGRDMAGIDMSATLFGQRLEAPILFAPVGIDGAIWPGATRLIAEAARDTGLGYMTGTLSCMAVEEVARILPGRLWFQLYGFPEDGHRISFDLVRRAAAAGVKVLAATVDTPLPARRIRDMRNGIALPFRLQPRMALDALRRPAWLAALARHGMPRFWNAAAYCPPGAGRVEVDGFVARNRVGTGFTWEVLARLRDHWQGALLVKGVMHPADAERAAALGYDGVIVSNHGGRQFDPAPATVDVLPAVRAAAGARLAVLLDGGILSGGDVLKAVALGADAVLVGRAVMLGLAGLGDLGARHVAETLKDELRIALGQSGALTLAGARRLALRHPTAWRTADFAAAGGNGEEGQA